MNTFDLLDISSEPQVDKRVPKTIYMTREMVDALKAVASRERRSFSNQCQYYLTKCLASDGFHIDTYMEGNRD